jgi:hypothetical protein
MNALEYEILITEIAVEFTNNPLDKKEWKMGVRKTNRIEGFSKYKHQIDVSLECETDLVLIECKKWKKNVTVAEYLVLLGRVLDISKIKTKRVRGALVTTKGWQSGVTTLNSAYDDFCSLFQVTEVKEIRQRIHKAFIFGKINAGGTITGSLSIR